MKNEHERERVFQNMLTMFLNVQLFNCTSILEKFRVYLLKVHYNGNRIEIQINKIIY